MPALVTHVLGRRRGAPGKSARPTTVSAAALDRLSQYGWPGNSRELENVIERAALLCDGPTIEVGDLPPLAIHASEVPLPAAAEGGTLRERVAVVVRQVERQALAEALRLEEGSPTRAARRLGISRASFYTKAKELGISL